MSKIGLFGGSFDPVHLGHLRVAEEVRDRLRLDRVLFIPTAVQPLKKERNVAGTDDRLRMIRLAIRGNRFFRASDVEAKRGGISYSIDTVKSYSRRFDDLYFLIGVDAFSEMHLWKDYRDLFRYANFAVMVRPNHRVKDLIQVLPRDVSREVQRIDASTYEHTSGKRLFLLEITQLDISSTTIRSLVKEERSIRYLVSDPVARFIYQRGLYRG